MNTRPMALWTGLVAFALASCATSIAAPRPAAAELTDLWVSGEGGYRSYRIPAVVSTANGVVLAFAEGRVDGASDTGNIDLLLRRSLDGGDTWGPVQVVWDDGPNVCGNPCPVVDRRTGTVWLLATWNAGDVHESRVAAGFGADSRRVFALHSDDDGASWSAPRELTADVKRADWTWYATGPGAGIQLRRGAHAGRLVIPCDHKAATDAGEVWNGHTIHSDDGGATWTETRLSPSTFSSGDDGFGDGFMGDYHGLAVGGNFAYPSYVSTQNFNADVMTHVIETSVCAPDLAEPFGSLDFSDVVAFLAAFAAMDPAADFAPPTGSFDFSDVVGFLAAFGAGCP